jgi:IS30 family transposase
LTSVLKQQQLDWRRAQVLELSSVGYSQREIARTLQVDLAAVNRDIHFLRQQAQENLQRHIHETVPEEYQNCMTGMKRNLKQTLEIAETVSDPKVKLQARAIANDCYKYIMDLATNGVVVTNALEYIQGKTDHLNESEKKLSQEGKGEESESKESEEPDYGEEEELEEGQEKDTGELEEEEEKTTNDVF